MGTNVKTYKTYCCCTHDSIDTLGVWVYSGVCEGQIFKRFNTIAEAVIEAVKYKDAHVIHNGIEIQYGKITDTVVYYTCINNGALVCIDTEQLDTKDSTNKILQQVNR